MPVPFGFSLGDFIGSVEFFLECYRAVQDTHGASADYQAHVDWLNSLIKTLQVLGSEEGEITPQLTNKLRQQLLDFKRHNIDKYESRLGSDASGSFLKVAGRKLQWTFARDASKNVARFRELIQPQLHEIQLQFGLQSRKDIMRQVNGLQGSSANQNKRVMSKMESLQNDVQDLRLNLTNTNDHTRAAVEDLTNRFVSELNTMWSAQDRTTAQLTQIAETIQQLNTNVTLLHNSSESYGPPLFARLFKLMPLCLNGPASPVQNQEKTLNCHSWDDTFSIRASKKTILCSRESVKTGPQKRYRCIVNIPLPKRMSSHRLCLVFILTQRPYSWPTFLFQPRAVRIVSFDAPIVTACISRDLEKVQELFGAGLASPFDTTERGGSLLEISATSMSLFSSLDELEPAYRLIKLLAGLGVDFDASDEGLNSIPSLHQAINKVTDDCLYPRKPMISRLFDTFRLLLPLMTHDNLGHYPTDCLNQNEVTDWLFKTQGPWRITWEPMLLHFIDDEDVAVENLQYFVNLITQGHLIPDPNANFLNVVCSLLYSEWFSEFLHTVETEGTGLERLENRTIRDYHIMRLVAFIIARDPKVCTQIPGLQAQWKTYFSQWNEVMRENDYEDKIIEFEGDIPEVERTEAEQQPRMPGAYVD